jgi:hypothetical protein
VPLVGPVIVLGYLAAATVAALEGAILVGGVSAIAAGLYGLGIPRDSVLEYETAIEADAFLVMAHDTPGRVAQAKDILDAADALKIDIHAGDDGATLSVEPAAAAA